MLIVLMDEMVLHINSTLTAMNAFFIMYTHQAGRIKVTMETIIQILAPNYY